MFSVHISDDAKDSRGHDGGLDGTERNLLNRVWLAGDVRVHIQSTSSAVLLEQSPYIVVGCANFDTALTPLEATTGKGDRPSPLERLLAASEESGLNRLAALHGEFSAAVWHGRCQELYAVRDHVGQFPLYYKLSGRSIVVSDTLDAFAGGSACDEEFIARFILTSGYCGTRTIWSGVFPVPPGSILTWREGRVRIRKYWDPTSFVPQTHLDGDEGGREFARLLKNAVFRALEPESRSWVLLSGGLDSSSVAAVAGRLCEESIARTHIGGTLTFVDSLANGDETRFSNAVVEQFAFRNVRIEDDWPWRDDGEPPLPTAQPARDFPFYARQRQILRTMQASGGTTLLTGVGPDHFFPTTAHHIPDLFWRGRPRDAVTQLYWWTLLNGESLARTFVRDLLVPLAIPILKPVVSRREVGRARWLNRRFASRHVQGPIWPDGQLAWPGSRYQSSVIHSMESLSVVHSWLDLPGISLRHPFLDVPLMEFCLRLPFALRTNALRAKPLLRMAMKGTVPDVVLNRATKGGLLDPRLCWAFRHERHALTRLLSASMLADLGCIEPARLAEALDDSGSGLDASPSHLYAALALETWLQVKSGRCIVDSRCHEEKERVNARENVSETLQASRDS